MLDEILLKRAAPPPPSSNLAERIIAASRLAVQDSRSFWEKALEVLQQGILVPQPAMAFAAVMLFGIVLGANTELGIEIVTEDLASYMVVEDTLNSGEFL